MDVVASAAGLERRRFEVIEDADEVGVQTRTDGLLDEGFTMFGAEDQMDQHFGERLRHRSVALSGQESVVGTSSQGVALG